MAMVRGFSWGSFFMGAVALFLVIALVAAAVVLGGLYPVAASTGDPPGVGALLEAARDHGVENSAKGLKPRAFAPADIQQGGSHFKGMCQECHGGPGVERENFAGAMNPRPPDLAEATDDLSVSEVFWIEKNGLKMSGMPAFGNTDGDEELWKIAAFVKQLRKTTPQQYAAIPNAHEESGGD